MLMNNIVCIPFNDEVNIIFDKKPNFTTIVTSFLLEQDPSIFPYPVDYFFNIRTECKGDMIQQQIKIVDNLIKDYKFVAMYDDDIEIKVSEIEKVFEYAEQNELDLFAPSLTHDSHHTYDFTLNKNSEIRKVDWVEIMMPHFSKRFIEQFKNHLKNLSKYDFKSGYGYDIYLWPKVLEEINGNCAIIDNVLAKHNRAITSHGKVFTNGMNPIDEMNIVKTYIENFSPT